MIKKIKKLFQKIDVNISIEDIENQLQESKKQIKQTNFYSLFESNFMFFLLNEFIRHYDSFWDKLNIIDDKPNIYNINFYNGTLFAKIQKIFNKIFSSFLTKYDIEFDNLDDKILFFYIISKLFEIHKCYDAINNFEKYFQQIFKSKESFITLILLEWTSKNYIIPDSSEFYNSNFISIVKLAIDKVDEKKFLLSNTLDNLDYIFSQDVEQFKFDIYDLIKIAKKYIEKLIDSQNINVDKEYFWDTYSLVGIYRKSKLKLWDFELKKYEKLILIYIGFNIKKKQKIDLSKKINEVFGNKSNLNNATCLLNSLPKNKSWIATEILDTSKKLYFDEFILDIGFKAEEYFLDKLNNLNLLLEEKKVIDWFITRLNNFLSKYYKNPKTFTDYKLIDSYWKSAIYFLFMNKNNIKDGKEDIFYYTFIKTVDYYLSIELRGKSFINISEEKIIEVNNKIYSKNIFNIEKNKINIRNVYGKFLSSDELQKIDEIVLVDNNLLSLTNSFKFSYYEFMGDIIYHLVINLLILDAKIYTDNNNIFSAQMQEQISKSLNFRNNIQKNSEVYHWKNKETSPADYFEAFLYFIYKIKGLEFTKSVVFNLIKENFSNIVIDNQTYNEIMNYFHYSTKNLILNKYKKLTPFHFVDLNSLSIVKEKIEKEINLDNLYKNVIKDSIKLTIIENNLFLFDISEYGETQNFKQSFKYTSFLNQQVDFLYRNIVGHSKRIIDITSHNLIYKLCSNYKIFTDDLIEILKGISKNEY